MTRSTLPVIACDLPVLFEDEGQEDMGDSWPHSTALNTLAFSLGTHLAGRPGREVLTNMNLYYHPTRRWAYVSPDVMVVTPPAPLPADLRSYRVGATGPAPVLAVEVLSQRTFQQGDLTLKPVIYAELGVAEYLLVDTTGHYLPERLQLRTLDGDAWITRPDEGDGVTSRLGFRAVIEDDRVRLVDAATGGRYAWPDEAQRLARERFEDQRARQAAEARVRELEAELARLRGGPPTAPPPPAVS